MSNGKWRLKRKEKSVKRNQPTTINIYTHESCIVWSIKTSWTIEIDLTVWMFDLMASHFLCAPPNELLHSWISRILTDRIVQSSHHYSIVKSNTQVNRSMAITCDKFNPCIDFMQLLLPVLQVAGETFLARLLSSCA